MLLLGYRNVEIKHSLSCTGCIRNTLDSFSSDGKESAGSVGDLSSIPGLGRSPGERNGYLFQYSCLENSRDRGAWRATAHSISKSPNRTERLSLWLLQLNSSLSSLNSLPCLPSPSLPPSFKVSAILVAYWQQIFWNLPALAHILFCAWNVVLWVPLPDNIL